MMIRIPHFSSALLASVVTLTYGPLAYSQTMPTGVDFAQPTDPKRLPTHAPSSTHPTAVPKFGKASMPTRNAYAVSSTISVKDTPQKEIDLPGVLHVPGEKLGLLDSSRARKLSWTNGGAQTVYVSATEQNRVELPFANPRVIRTSDITVIKRVTSNNVYVYWNSADPKPALVWFEPPGGGSLAVGLQFVPKAVTGQTIFVTDDSGLSATQHKKSQQSDDYIPHVQDLMASVALHQIPDGYSESALALPPISMDGLMVTADKRYSGSDGDIWVYSVRNPGPTRAVLEEQEFDGPTVLAVSIFPKPVLEPGQETSVFVYSRKREED